MASIFKNTIGGAIGNAIEWYDFAIFGFSAPIISQLFFPKENAITALLSVYILFAVGFLSRPLGSFIFGHIGDRFGRTTTLKITVWLMSIPTVLIGLMPTYAVIGVWCPILITILRLLQGLAMGGEFTGSIIYLTEMAPKKKEGLFGSFGYVSTTSGILIGSAVIALTHVIFTKADVLDWGWRLPFLLAIFIGIAAYYLRKKLPEPSLPELKEKLPHPVKQAFLKDFNKMLDVFGLNFFNAVGFYTFFVFTVSYLSHFVGTSESYALNLTTISLVLLIGLMPLSGWLSDKLGRKTILSIASVILLVFIYPAYHFMSADHLVLTAVLMLCIAVLFGLIQGSLPVIFVHLFPHHTRASGLSISFNISNALFGGTAPAVATWLIKTYQSENVFIFYLIIAMLIFLFTLWRVRLSNN